MWRQHSGGSGGWNSMTLYVTKSRNWSTMVSLSSLVVVGVWMMRLSPTISLPLINSLGVLGEFCQPTLFSEVETNHACFLNWTTNTQSVQSYLVCLTVSEYMNSDIASASLFVFFCFVYKFPLCFPQMAIISVPSCMRETIFSVGILHDSKHSNFKTRNILLH